MGKANTVVLLKLDFPSRDEDEWNDWYDNIHAKEWLSFPGIDAIRRFELAPGMPQGWDVPAPKHLIVYELSSIDVIVTEEYNKLVKRVPLWPSEIEGPTDLSGGVFQQIIPIESSYKIPLKATHLLAVGHAEIPLEVEEEYHAWYNTEHIPAYLEIPGFLTARRFQRVDDIAPFPGISLAGADYIALYDLSDNSVFETPEFKIRGVTPWSTRIRDYTWQRRKMNNLYKSVLMPNNEKD